MRRKLSIRKESRQLPTGRRTGHNGPRNLPQHAGNIFSSVTELSIRVPIRDVVLGNFNSYMVSIEHTIY